MRYAIKTQKLTKIFDGNAAVDKLSFSVERGELFGLLGPNGAGKTTTINMLSTLLEPTSGCAEVAGFNVLTQRDEVRCSIGIVFQDPALDIKLTGRENLDFHSMMYGMERREREERIDEVLEMVELTDRQDTLVENYSGGMKRRLEMARGLIHRPKVLFLDEPTLGLDAQTRRRIWDYIKKLNKEEDITIILTTHYMEEADFLCDRIAIMDFGKIIALDTPEKLKDVVGGDVVSLEISGDVNGFTENLNSLEWVRAVKKHNSKLGLTVEKGEKRIPELINIALENGMGVDSVNLRKPSLEDVFLHFTGKTIREKESSRNKTNKELIMRRMRK